MALGDEKPAEAGQAKATADKAYVPLDDAAVEAMRMKSLKQLAVLKEQAQVLTPAIVTKETETVAGMLGRLEKLLESMAQTKKTPAGETHLVDAPKVSASHVVMDALAKKLKLIEKQPATTQQQLEAVQQIRGALEGIQQEFNGNQKLEHPDITRERNKAEVEENNASKEAKEKRGREVSGKNSNQRKNAASLVLPEVDNMWNNSMKNKTIVKAKGMAGELHDLLTDMLDRDKPGLADVKAVRKKMDDIVVWLQQDKEKPSRNESEKGWLEDKIKVFTEIKKKFDTNLPLDDQYDLFIKDKPKRIGFEGIPSDMLRIAGVEYAPERPAGMMGLPDALKVSGMPMEVQDTRGPQGSSPALAFLAKMTGPKTRAG